MIKYIHELVSPSDYAREEKIEHLIGLVLYSACLLCCSIALISTYAT